MAVADDALERERIELLDALGAEEGGCGVVVHADGDARRRRDARVDAPSMGGDDDAVMSLLIGSHLSLIHI